MDEHHQRAIEILGATGRAMPSKVDAVAEALRDADRQGYARGLEDARAIASYGSNDLVELLRGLVLDDTPRANAIRTAARHAVNRGCTDPVVVAFAERPVAWRGKPSV